MLSASLVLWHGLNRPVAMYVAPFQGRFFIRLVDAPPPLLGRRGSIGAMEPDPILTYGRCNDVQNDITCALLYPRIIYDTYIIYKQV